MKDSVRSAPLPGTPGFGIGVDGGGTKTELILCDARGTVVARHTAPGCNPSHAGPEQARATLDAALAALTASHAGPVTRCHLFMAGAPEFWRDYAARLTGCGQVTSGTDALPVLELATGGDPGLVLHSGTGSFIAARAPDGTVHSAGGLGWKLGDPGSGFDLGRRGAARALLELQGWAPPSGLGAALLAHTGLTTAADASRFFYSDPAANARLAAFAPVVLDLAEAGQAPARAILESSLGDLAGQAELVLGKLFPDAPAGGPPPPSKIENPKSKICLGVSGPILNRPFVAALLRELIATRPWPVTLHFISEPPIEGVRRLLAKSRATE